MALKKGLKRGFTLVELMIVVAIIGVLAALAIYGVRRYVFTAKTSEAKAGVGRMAKDAANAFNGEQMAENIVTLGSSAANSNQLCDSATNTVPGSVAPISGKKYQSSPADWMADQATRGKGFACMGFSMTDPQYYMYEYTADATSGTGATFTAAAHGDLDGDSNTSTFSLLGQIQSSSDGLVVTVAPNFGETDPLE